MRPDPTIPDYWTAKQALAVYDFLDALRDRVWDRYGEQITEQLCLDLYLPPVPMNVAVLRRCLERANHFDGDTSARVMRIDTKHVDAIKSANLQVQQRRDQYVYAPGRYQEIGGKGFYAIRRNVQLIECLPDVEVMPYSRSHAKACHELLGQWKQKHLLPSEISPHSSTQIITV